MAKTRRHPMDHFNAEARECLVAEQISTVFEQGRQKFREEVLSPLMGTLKEIDPEWENWYDASIPEIVSLKRIAELVEQRIEYINARQMIRDYADMQDTTRSIISTFYS